ncbi:MAG: EcsC family protein [Desulfovibrionaceae bacterium]|nr:EcsC family protein [Desulfovibrionaceae bacterium]
MGEVAVRELNESTIMSAAAAAFDKALSGLPGMGSCKELADQYLEENETVEEAIDSLVRWQTGKAGLGGLVTGLGGLPTLPVAIPAGMFNLFYHQMRMVGATAYMCGYNPDRSDKARVICLACLAGDSVHALLREAGVQLGRTLLFNTIKGLSGQVIRDINRAVGMRLITKFGSTGVLNLGKAIPVVGGLVSGGMDAGWTYSVGMGAKQVFLGR